MELEMGQGPEVARRVGHRLWMCAAWRYTGYGHLTLTLTPTLTLALTKAIIARYNASVFSFGASNDRTTRVFRLYMDMLILIRASCASPRRPNATLHRRL